MRGRGGRGGRGAEEEEPDKGSDDGGTEVAAEVGEPAQGDDPEPLTLTLQGAPEAPAALDLMLVIDTTGSMGDELAYLKSELDNVIRKVKRDAGQALDVRLSVNYYRDRGDDYLVRSRPFSTDIEAVLEEMSGQCANGGDDYPEAVEAGLSDAIFEHEWRDSARARVLIPVLDAPPHTGEVVEEALREAVEAAAATGVRMAPVAASGVDTATEMMLRSFAIATGGTYAFLTDHSGIGGAHLEPTIGDYEVELLADALGRVITSYAQASPIQ